MPFKDQKHLLLLCDYHRGSAGTIVDHVMAFPRYSRHRIWVLSRLGDLPPALDLNRFDGIILHYSLVISYDSFLSKSARAAIRRFKGFKAVFIQDDYRWVNRTVSAMQYMRVNAIFCLAPQNVVDLVYSPLALPGVTKTTVLAGYVPEELTRIDPKLYPARTIDVGYRARKLPAWIGTHAQDKWLIADRFRRDGPRYGLACDISCREEDRIYGPHWIDFLRNCKAVLGSESGSSVCDFTGEIQSQVEAHEQRHQNVDFETLRELYFREVDGKIMMNIISPRCFEAAALRTLMILYEGHYSGVLAPWRHYVPLRKDHSNMDEVVGALRNPDRWSEIVECAYREIALNPRYSFRAMVEQFDQVVERSISALPGRSARPYIEWEFSRTLTPGARSVRGRAMVEDLALIIEQRLQAILIRLIAPLKNRRLRDALKRTYFALLGFAADSYGMAAEMLGMLRVIRATHTSAAIRLLWHLQIPLSKKVALVRELNSMGLAESFALDDDAFSLRVRADPEERVLWIEAEVSGSHGATLDDRGGWEEVTERVVRERICGIRWRIKDEWNLAPRPRIPDGYEFPVLSEILGAQPDSALQLVRHALSRVAEPNGHEVAGPAVIRAS